MKENEQNDVDNVDIDIDTVEAKIVAFSAKIGQETENKYTVYVYRMIKNEETGRTDRPFVAKFVGVEPDPYQIAEKYRGGKYLITFMWKKGKESKNKSFIFDVDMDTFPPIPKQGSSSMLPVISGNANLSENMQISLVMMQTIGEVMKEAYRSGSQNVGPVQRNADPVDNFSSILDTIEGGYMRAMSIQSKLMERVFTRSMEQKFGLPPESPAPEQDMGDSAGAVAQYMPIVKEVVDGLKTVFSFFGEKVPKKVVQQVRSNERFQALISDPDALRVVGQALRNEFGNDRAQSIMNSFGVKMIVRPKQIPHQPVEKNDVSAAQAEKTGVEQKKKEPVSKKTK
jgi:hypothetical protein